MSKNRTADGHLGRSLILIVVVLFAASVLVAVVFFNSGIWDRIWAYYDLLGDRDWVRATIKSAGWGATLVFMLLQVGQVLFAPIPGEVTGFIGGYVFGAWQGFLLSSIALTAGSMLNFAIGHYLGDRFVRRLVRAETFEKYDRMVRYKGVLVIFLLFLIPGFPKDYLCMFLGLTTMPARLFFVVSTVGRTPGTLALSLQGASIFDKDYMFFAVVTGVSLLFALIAFLCRNPLYRWMERLNHRKQK